MIELWILPDRTCEAYRLWPEPMSIPPGIVRENASHVLELRSTLKPDEAFLEIEGIAPKPLRNPAPNVARWEWAVGFHAGMAEVDVKADGQRFRTTVTLDPDLRKMSRSDFECMVFECLEDLEKVFALSQTRMGVDRGEIRPPLARLEFLRSRLPDLERAVRRVIAQPHRKLEAVVHPLPIQKARQISGKDLALSLRFGPHIRVDDRTLPGRVVVKKKLSSVDTAENRSIKAFLIRWTGWLDRAAASFTASVTGDDEETRGTCRVWARRCTAMAMRMKRLLADPFFSEISNETMSSEGSAVFRCVGGYQQFGKIRRDMNMGLAAIAGRWLDMPISRTWEIYELWVFLRLARACIDLGGEQVAIQGLSDDSGHASIPDTSFGITAGNGLQVVFQREYREYWKAADHQGSFSRVMIPDVAITISAGGVKTLLVLDAKYRVNTGINDALTSIHTYRDALVEEAGTETQNIVKGAYLVSPHLPTEFLADWKAEENATNRVFHPAYRQKFRFGAVTMRPGATSLSDAKKILETLASASGISLTGEGAPVLVRL